jgi:small subunit ribosomal protein S17
MKTSTHRILRGIVTSTAMQKTAVVRIDRQVTHAKYGKKYTLSRKFKIHDPEAKARMGDVVEFEECRPLSKDKRWRYRSTITAAAGTPAA